jgi:hypothetical protein
MHTVQGRPRNKISRLIAEPKSSVIPALSRDLVEILISIDLLVKTGHASSTISNPAR